MPPLQNRWEFRAHLAFVGTKEKKKKKKNAP
ncbi:hypothetical protein QG37_04426 [Candidozyma auris]|uniref:Uncharacterized protein n=1 Tax=Candidozyma auris TaxID=498019 RepID=A0A0L0NWJ6_CANAR|nr:hypothetical protein QG37_04426 [[Candida] auris]